MTRLPVLAGLLFVSLSFLPGCSLEDPVASEPKGSGSEELPVSLKTGSERKTGARAPVDEVVLEAVSARIDALVGAVNQLVATETLNRGQGNALIAKLSGAKGQLERHKATPAINMLRAFIRQVDAFREAGILSEAQNLDLTGAAQHLVDALVRHGLCPLVELVEEQCIATNDLADKKPLYDEALELQRKLDALGSDECVFVLESICGGLIRGELLIEPPETRIDPGETQQLSATMVKNACVGGESDGQWCEANGDCENGTCEEIVLIGDIEWTSLDESVATVDPRSGMVTGIAAGDTEVAAASVDFPDFFSATAAVAVGPPLDRVVVSPTEMSLWVGSEGALAALLLDGEGNSLPLGSREVEWESSKADLISVEGNGLEAVVFAHAPGTVTISATVDGHIGEATVNAAVRCPASPSIPDCTARIDRGFVADSGCTSLGSPSRLAIGQCSISGEACTADEDCDKSAAGDDAELNTCEALRPESEVFVQMEFSDCCEWCCGNPPQCGPGLWCDTWIGSATEWRILDQNDGLLNSDNGASGGGAEVAGHTGFLWDRGNAGICGNPTVVETEGIVDSGNCWTSVLRVVERPGWNQTGCQPDHAATIGEESSWCGSMNEAPCGGSSGSRLVDCDLEDPDCPDDPEWYESGIACDSEDPECTTDRYWRVSLDTGDRLEIAMRLWTGTFGGTSARLELQDTADGRTLLWRGFVGEEGREERLSWTNDGPAGTFFVILNVNDGFALDPDRPGHDLWEYNLGFSVAKADCIETLPDPVCPPEVPDCF